MKARTVEQLEETACDVCATIGECRGVVSMNTWDLHYR
jgi:hypothetical protein